MNTLVALGIYAVLFLGVLSGGWAIVHKHDTKVKEAALSPWKPLLDKCKTAKLDAATCEQQWTSAVNANLTLQEDVKRNAAETLACNDKVTEAEARGRAAASAGAAAAAKAAPVIKGLKDRMTELQLTISQLENTRDTMGCNAHVLNLGKDVLDLATARLRDHPPVPEKPGPALRIR